MTARKPIAFLATANADVTRDFYANVLGLTLVETSPFALVFSDAGQMLRIQIVVDLNPASFTAYGWQVSDIGAEMAKLIAKGVAFLTFPHLNQDADGVWTTPNDARIAWFKDPSGNILSLTEFAGDGV